MSIEIRIDPATPDPSQDGGHQLGDDFEDLPQATDDELSQAGDIGTEEDRARRSIENPEARPTFSRFARRYLSLSTLRYYKIPFQIDPDADYVLIKRWVPEAEQDMLWAHTAALRKERLATEAEAGPPIPEPEKEDEEERDDDPTTDFAWLDSIFSDDCYMNCDWDNPSKSSDLGCNGYTASLSDWGDLLQLSAPSEVHGTIYVRGPFPDRAGSYLARAQRLSHKDSIGIKFLQEDGYEVDYATAQGYINLRWPFFQYTLSKDDEDFAVCRICSYVKDSVFYQVMRIDPSQYKTSEDTKTAKTFTFRVGVGGLIRFGDAQDLTRARIPDDPKDRVVLSDNDTVLSCLSGTRTAQLNMRLFVNRTQTPLKYVAKPVIDPLQDGESQLPYTDISTAHELSISGKPIIIVLAMELKYTPHSEPLPADFPVVNLVDKPRSENDDLPPPKDFQKLKITENLDVLLPKPVEPNTSFDEPLHLMTKKASSTVENYLGASDPSVNAPYRLWRNCLRDDDGGVQLFRTNAIGRAVEYVLGVSAIPLPTYSYQKTESRERDPDESSGGSALKEGDVAAKVSSTTENPTPELHDASTSLMDSVKVDVDSTAPTDVNTGDSNHTRTSFASLANGNAAKQLESPSGSDHQPQASKTPTEADSVNDKDRDHSDSKIGTVDTKTVDFEVSHSVQPDNVTEGSKDSLPVPNAKTDSSTPKPPAATVTSNERTGNEFLDVAGEKVQTTEAQSDVVDEEKEQDRIALLHSIVMNHRVNWTSLFSQLRLLIKAYRYLRLQAGLKPLPEKDEHQCPLREIDRLYKIRLLAHIRGVLFWILKVGYWNFDSVEILKADQSDEEYDAFEGPTTDTNPFFSLIIAFYILKHIPDLWSNDEHVRREVWKSDTLKGSLTRATYAQEGSANFALVKWYYMVAMTELCKLLRKDDETRFQKEFQEFDIKETEKRANYWRGKAERSLRTSGKGQSVPYSIVDLVLLAHEILADPVSLQNPSSAVSWVRKSIQSRDPTTVLNPGQKPNSRDVSWRDFSDTTYSHQTAAPWELCCLNHLSVLRLSADEDIDTAEEDCQRFLFSESTFMPSWDRADPWILEGWWDPDTSCQVASTLLDNLMKDLRSSAPGTVTIDGPPGTTAARDRVAYANRDGRRIMNSGEPFAIYQSDYERQSLNLNKRILNVLTRSDESSEDYDWKSQRQESYLLYHGESLYSSLEDTPDKFLSKQTKNVSLRANLKKYFARKSDDIDGKPSRGTFIPPKKSSKRSFIDPPHWTMATIKENLPPKDLLYMSCFDLKLQFFRVPEVSIRSQQGRARPDLQEIGFDKDPASTEPKIPPIVNEYPRFELNGRQTSSLWSLWLNGHPEIHPDFKNSSKEVRQAYADPKKRDEVLKDYQNSFLEVLTDSMVDQGVNYRILFAHRCTPTIVQAFIYMLHTRSLDTFDDYFGPMSSFFDTSVDDVWTSSITISYWGLIRNNQGLSSDFDEERGDKASFPPKSISGHRNLLARLVSSRAAAVAEEVEISLLSSSICISGPETGTSFTCSVISSLMDEISVQSIIRNEVTRILLMFIHQPIGGRCLVFLLLLGYISQHLAQECEIFTDSLDGIMGMGQAVLLTGMEWEKSEVALNKLKKMLWCLEALRNFDDKLTTSLSEIKEARKQTLAAMSKSSGQRHKDLSRFTETILDEFDKRVGQLDDSHSTILQRIEQSARLREGITSVLGVEQNENIGMLTYITLAYLPLGFVAALFSVSHEVLPDSWGAGYFSWLTVVFFVATFVFALSLQTILGAGHRFGKVLDRRAEGWERLNQKKRGRSAASGAKEAKKEKGDEKDGKDGDKETAADTTAVGMRQRMKAALRRRIAGKPAGRMDAVGEEEKAIGNGSGSGSGSRAGSRKGSVRGNVRENGLSEVK